MGKAVIKAGEAGAVPALGMRGLDLRDIGARCEEMLSGARAEAERIVRDARQRTESERAAAVQAARREGHAQGLKEGRATGETQGRETALAEARAAFDARLVELGRTLTRLVSEFNERREGMYLAARRDVIALALAVASRVVGSIAGESAPGELAGAACAEALERIGKATQVVIRLHPEDAATMRVLVGGNVETSKHRNVETGEEAAENCAALEEALRAMAGRHVELVDDPAVERGGAIVATAECEIDATVSGRVERISDEVLAEWRARQAALGVGNGK